MVRIRFEEEKSGMRFGLCCVSSGSYELEVWEGGLTWESGSSRLRGDPETPGSAIQNITLHLKINTSQLKESQIPI